MSLRCLLPALILLWIALACAPSALATPTLAPTRPAATGLPPTLIPPTRTPALPFATTANLSDLWHLTRGDVKSDEGWGVDTDSQGNIYVAAHMQQPPSRPFYDMVIFKFTPDGRELWQTQWGGEFQEKAFVVVVSEPYVYVGGLAHTSMNLTEADMALLALDASTGKVLWKFTWGQGFGYEEVDGLAVDGENIYLSGWTTGEKSDGDMAILKLDRKGSLLWAKTWGTDGFDSADGQMVVDRDAVYICGRVNGRDLLTGGDAALVKFRKDNGEYLAHTTWGGAAFDDGLGMTSDGQSLFVVGLTLSFGNGGQIFVLKYDKSLKLEWQQVWGGPKGESARAVEVDGDRNILVAGATASYGNGEDDVVMLQFDQKSVLNWTSTWGGSQRDATHGLAIDGNFAILAGNTLSFGKGQTDVLVIKADRKSGQFPALPAEK